MIPMIIQDTVENRNYLAIVLFILVGNIANATNMSERIFDFAITLVGRMKGGLAQANVLASKEAGAMGFIPKAAASSRLITGIRSVARGDQSWIESLSS